jgi:hypothetical protein
MSDGPRQSCTWRTRSDHGELLPSPWDRPVRVGSAPIRDRGGMAVGPRDAQPNTATRPWQSFPTALQAEPTLRRRILQLLATRVMPSGLVYVRAGVWVTVGVHRADTSPTPPSWLLLVALLVRNALLVGCGVRRGGR